MGALCRPTGGMSGGGEGTVAGCLEQRLSGTTLFAAEREGSCVKFFNKFKTDLLPKNSTNSLIIGMKRNELNEA
jgi:hypothetical protein